MTELFVFAYFYFWLAHTPLLDSLKGICYQSQDKREPVLESSSPSFSEITQWLLFTKSKSSFSNSLFAPRPHGLPASSSSWSSLPSPPSCFPSLIYVCQITIIDPPF